MIFVLICTEGNVSEPAYIRALTTVLGGQSPKEISTNVEVLPIPLGGNHGHKKLIDVANQAVEQYVQNSIVTLAGDEDSIEKWIIVDYDDMDKHGIRVEELRKNAEDNEYILVVNKPNFEFFVLTHLVDLNIALDTKSDQYTQAINAQIRLLNTKDKNEKGFTKEMLIPPYSKKEHMSDKFFGLLLSHHEELVVKVATLDMDTTKDSYTEMPRVIERLRNLYYKA